MLEKVRFGGSITLTDVNELLVQLQYDMKH